MVFFRSLSSISIVESDLAVEDTVIGESDAMGVAAEVVEHGLWAAERLFRIEDPVLFA